MKMGRLSKLVHEKAINPPAKEDEAVNINSKE